MTRAVAVAQLLPDLAQVILNPTAPRPTRDCATSRPLLDAALEIAVFDCFFLLPVVEHRKFVNMDRIADALQTLWDEPTLRACFFKMFGTGPFWVMPCKSLGQVCSWDRPFTCLGQARLWDTPFTSLGSRPLFWDMPFNMLWTGPLWGHALQHSWDNPFLGHTL